MSKEKKKGTGKAHVITWASVTTFLVAMLLVVTILTTSSAFYDIICTVIGGEQPKFASGVDPIYTTEYKNKKEVLTAANDLNERVCEEGFVLLKNDGGEDEKLPLATPVSNKSVSAKPKVSIFGKNSVNLAYGGSGSGGFDDKNATTLYDGLKEAGYDVNPQLKKFYESSASGNGRSQNSGDLDSGDTVYVNTGETPLSKYSGGKIDSYIGNYKDMAVIVFTRIGGEGFDLPRTMKGMEGAANDSDHYLQLDKNEKDLITAVTGAGFKKVVVVLNSGTSMEMGELEKNDKVNSIIWMGFPGGSGANALGKILSGEVNPSGRTVDTWAADFKKDPTWNNFGDNLSATGDKYRTEAGEELYYFTNYEEGIYVGYRYYETRGTDEAWYKENVVYPLGYGLSYTAFEWSVKDASAINGKNVTDLKTKYTLEVDVKNTGSVDGYEVVQLYGHAPYLGTIEKPEEVLLDFAKVWVKAGETKNVTLTFDPYYLASYDYKCKSTENGGYVLEADGDYALYISANAHDKKFTVPFTVNGTVKSLADPVTDNEVVNRYTNCEEKEFDTNLEKKYFNSDLMLDSVLSRSSWNGTFPTAPTDADRLIDEDFIDALKDRTHNNTTDFDSIEYPWFDDPVEKTLFDLLNGDLDENYYAMDFDNDDWELVLSACNAQELAKMITFGAFKTSGITSIGKNLTNDTDGPGGFTNFMSKDGTYWGTCHYCAEIVMASTWNTDLIEEVGEMVGSEGIIGADGKGNSLCYSGWYAPGVNIHRSPFGGRNFEYFSEDGVLSGKMAAAEVKGCRSKGVYCFVKHFALNEQETHRSIGGNCTFATEQAIREIYLKPFEIAVKDGKATGIMSSFTRIGTRWTGGDYRLLTEILRNEWGFKGSVITDFNTTNYMDLSQMVYAGGDINLATYWTPGTSWLDESSMEDLIVLRKAAKNIFYTVGNSNAMNYKIVGYGMPKWLVAIVCLDVIIPVGLAVWGFFAIRIFLKRRKEKATEEVAANQAIDNF